MQSNKSARKINSIYKIQNEINDYLDSINNQSDTQKLESVKHFLDGKDDSYLNQILIIAAGNNYADILDMVMLLGADVKVENYKPFRLAAEYGHLNIVKKLIKCSDIHANNDDALFEACRNGYIHIVRYLISKGANIHALDDQALLIAAYNRHLDVVEVLIKAGANVKANNNIIKQYKDNHQSLVNAAKNGFIKVIKRMADSGLNIHENHEEALLAAASNGQLKVVKFLIKNGGNVHADYDSDLGDGAFRWAAAMNDMKMVKFLIKKGAYIRANQDGALSCAARNNHLCMVKFLIGIGLDIHKQDNRPFRWAVANLNYEMARYLIRLGANINIMDNITLQKAITTENLDELLNEDAESLEMKINNLKAAGRKEISPKKLSGNTGSLISYLTQNNYFKIGGYLIKVKKEYFIYFNLDFTQKYKVRFQDVKKIWIESITN